jgi:hypothetical protein
VEKSPSWQEYDGSADIDKQNFISIFVNYINRDIIADEQAAVLPLIYLLYKLFKILSRVRVTLNRVLDWKLDLLITFNKQLVTTLNYSAITDFHTLQITTAHAKSFQSALISRFPITDLKKWRFFECTNQVVPSQTPLQLTNF